MGDCDDERSTPPICAVDPYEYLQAKKNPDGTITRFEFPSTPSTTDPNNPSPTITKDVPLNPKNKTWMRLFLPMSSSATTASSSPTKLPIVLYFHGGGFVVFHADTSMNHDLCAGLAAESNVLIISIEYRLSPEHRLPAAYDDAMEALEWINHQGCKSTVSDLDEVNDDWVQKYGDKSRCFVMGSSSGGNIAYHVGLRASCHLVNDIDPLIRIKGLILHQPFFGSVQRAESELKFLNCSTLPLSGSDLMWDLALPFGADRDHEYCNLKVSKGAGLERIKELGWPVLVTGCGGDPLIDRGHECVMLLKEKGINVKTYFIEDGIHAVELVDPVKAKAFFVVVKEFLEYCFQFY